MVGGSGLAEPPMMRRRETLVEAVADPARETLTEPRRLG